MGIFSSIFGKPVDKVGGQVRQNTALVESHMKNVYSQNETYGDFELQYLYTSSEPISRVGEYGSVIYIRIESPAHEFVSALPADMPEIQRAIDEHQKKVQSFPSGISKDITKFLYFNMGKIFRSI